MGAAEPNWIPVLLSRVVARRPKAPPRTQWSTRGHCTGNDRSGPCRLRRGLTPKPRRNSTRRWQSVMRSPNLSYRLATRGYVERTPPGWHIPSGHHRLRSDPAFHAWRIRDLSHASRLSDAAATSTVTRGTRHAARRRTSQRPWSRRYPGTTAGNASAAISRRNHRENPPPARPAVT